jgi:hypothetical protein
MSNPQGTQSNPQVPQALFGVLQGHETTTRAYSCQLPEGYCAILQKKPGDNVLIVEQSDTVITLSNQGDGSAFYLVLFLANTAVRAVLGAKEVVTFLAERFPRGRGPK